MKERQRESHMLSPERENLFRSAEAELRFPAQVYRLGDRFEGLTPELADVTMLDVTNIPGCHYGAKNVFVPIIRHLESTRSSDSKSRVIVSPEKAILVETSTGNGWVAFSDAAEKLGYEHKVIMPDGLPDARYYHPQGRKVEIIRTPKDEYAEGMPKQLRALMNQNRQRLAEGKKIYVSPNHAVASVDITIEAMSDLGRQLIANLGQVHDPLRVVISMGNGASLCAIGEYVKKHSSNAKVIAAESFAYGGGYDNFAKKRGLASYAELFDVDPGNPGLMAKFSAFGTNAPIGIKLPLHERAMNGDLIDDYVLFSDDKVLEAYRELGPTGEHLENALNLSNYSKLPRVLFETYGNSTLANISVASRFAGKGERVVAIAYDSRKQY
ncbi:MAG: pyridoxal-phosphate dependent enzyme [Candidatus Levybacteria bacterium]|nr:pyridoxal-phosphate dependent enzyme [Candidatus Levybacteria bacterium]